MTRFILPALFALLPLTLTGPANAQPLAEGVTQLSVTVGEQWQADFPPFVRLIPGQSTTVQGSVSSIVLADGASVLVSLMSDTDLTGLAISWDEGTWDQGTGFPGLLGPAFEPVALSVPNAKKMAGTMSFRMEGSPEPRTVTAIWKVEAVHP